MTSKAILRVDAMSGGIGQRLDHFVVILEGRRSAVRADERQRSESKSPPMDEMHRYVVDLCPKRRAAIHHRLAGVPVVLLTPKAR